MYRGSWHLGKIYRSFPDPKFQLPPLECGTHRKARGHLVAKVGTSNAGGTISQLGCSTRTPMETNKTATGFSLCHLVTFTTTLIIFMYYMYALVLFIEYCIIVLAAY
jgi:hypothetical protein